MTTLRLTPRERDALEAAGFFEPAAFTGDPHEATARAMHAALDGLALALPDEPADLEAWWRFLVEESNHADRLADELPVGDERRRHYFRDRDALSRLSDRIFRVRYG